MEEEKIDGIPITHKIRSGYWGEIDVGQTIQSNIDFWREKYFELEKNSIPISLIKEIQKEADKISAIECEEDAFYFYHRKLQELLNERNNTDE